MAKDDNSGSRIQRLHNQVTKLLNDFSSSPDDVENTNYNPEIFTSLKRQWAANFQLQHMDHRSWKEPSRLFESMVVVGLHPNCDVQALQRQYVDRKFEGSGKLRSALGHQNQSRVEPNIEPQVLFVYPPEKQLPLKCKDLLSFCFPGGLEGQAVKRTPSMSELNEMFFGQEHLKQMDRSFVFRLQGADNSMLYGCCVLVEELVQKPSGLLSLISNNRIFTQERLEQLTKNVGDLSLEFVEGSNEEENSKGDSESVLVSYRPTENLRVDGEQELYKERNNYDSVVPTEPETDRTTANEDSGPTISENGDQHGDALATNKQSEDRNLPRATFPLPHYWQCESSESSCSLCSFQGSPSEDRNFRSDVDDNKTEDASCSGQEDLDDLNDILEWAVENNCGPLQIICGYYRLGYPARGSALTFHPLEHLHPLEYCRPPEAVTYFAGSTAELKNCSTDLELADAHNALMVEETTSLSVWTIACLCGTLRLENVLTFFAGVMLEKQIIVVSSNLETGERFHMAGRISTIKDVHPKILQLQSLQLKDFAASEFAADDYILLLCLYEEAQTFRPKHLYLFSNFVFVVSYFIVIVAFPP